MCINRVSPDNTARVRVGGTRQFDLQQVTSDGIGRRFFPTLSTQLAFKSGDKVCAETLEQRCVDAFEAFANKELDAALPQALRSREVLIESLSKAMSSGSSLQEAFATVFPQHLQKEAPESDTQCKAVLNLIYTLGVDLVNCRGQVEMKACDIGALSERQKNSAPLRRMLRTVKNCYGLTINNISQRSLGTFLLRNSKLSELL